MAEYKRPTSEEEFKKNFKQKNPLMNDTQAYYESSRCLFCYDAPCIKACPTGIDIPLFIKQIHTDNITGASKTIFDSNWLGNACGVVCPTGVLCEGACVYNHQDVPPIQIGRLQNYATNKSIESNKKLFKAGEANGKKVAIIGAGPAGIACACELRVFGFEVDIYEAKEKPSGLTVHGIAPYKITNEEVLKEVKYLQDQLGFEIKYNSSIDTKEKIKELESNYNAIFIGVGLGKTATLGLEGEEKNGVVGAVEFIEELRMKHHLVKVPKRVVVIGGGNTAMDAASESARMGARKTVLAYRRSKEDMGAYKFEYDLAISAGVDSLFNVTPLEIIGNGKVEGVKFAKTQVVDGELKTDMNNVFTVKCDMVIKATGQAKQGHLYELIDDLQLDSKTRIKIDEETFHTSNLKYFAGGDAINGGAEVVNAAYDGKMAAHGIYKWLIND
ncbi:MAG: NAD(P)-dependent oxidoreductase [Flavobacteriaceae bacterium]|nr:NAD(P)-dependent oxidoreductase [Bacteroidia bacterium]NND26643.1 NAD(P)-dependent oxidoreductase [Flavobacteriaceae bacterium]MBT8279898.1 NAD(P)-dependent oxidoreductase [Bacteroidia bacterium]NNK60712.1 NAD(P)-dependent oxidoreductase [Flavobacteriaceae bacterium]NNL31902.1 NAD(P)-dependent oxidoreductase [Flavobacteriaceae bacterium]